MTSGNLSNGFPAFPSGAPPYEPCQHLPFLRAIQGNILKGHGRDCVRLLFFAADRRRTKPEKLFKEAVALGLVTSAEQQWQDARSGDRSRGLFSLMLTKEYFFVFNRQFPRESSGGAFRSGAYVRMEESVRRWKSVYRSHPHGLWLLAHANTEGLDAMEEQIRDLLGRHHVRVMQTREHGRRWHDAGDRDALREPFGFRDGISVASFLKPEPAAVSTVQMPLAQVLIPDGPHAGGSYFVLQKLEQDVAAFRKFETVLQQGFAAAGRALPVRSAGTLLVGRERDGTPLADGHTQATNDFDYTADPAASRCPFHAHIRKANPRGPADLESATGVLARQFVRRSAVYDDGNRLPEFSSADYAEGDNISGNVGLLFMGYMNDILRQFEHLRLSWLENPGFPTPGDQQPDPLLNLQSDPPVTEWKWSAGGISSVSGMPRFVTSRGAVFCYVPSLHWLDPQ